jgi:hypothetical protein
MSLPKTLKEVAAEFVHYWTKYRTPDGCGMCGSIPHSTTCYVGKMAVLLSSSDGSRCDCGAALTMCADCVIGDYQAAHPECVTCCPVQPAEGRETPDLHEAKREVFAAIARARQTSVINNWVEVAINKLITAALAHGPAEPR